MRSRDWLTFVVISAVMPISISRCDRFAVAPGKPTVFATNMTGRPLSVVVYDYSPPNPAFPGIYFSPEYTLGLVKSSGTACLSFTGLAITHTFVLIGEDTLAGVETQMTNMFVPADAPGWTVTFVNDTARPIGPTATNKGC